MPGQETSALLSRLETDALLDLYVLDASDLGGSILYFFEGTEANNQPVTWRGVQYAALPVETAGWETKSEGSPPRPTVKFANVAGGFSALVMAYDDLVGARFIRRRVFARFLDGRPLADPTQGLPDEIFAIDRKVREDRFSVEFELATPIDVEDTALPKRVIYANLCSWIYRGEGCGFAVNTAVADVFDNAPEMALAYEGAWSPGTAYSRGDVVYQVTARGLRRYYWCIAEVGVNVQGEAMGPSKTAYWRADECSRRINGCELRFKTDVRGLPFGGFPAASRIQS